MQPVQTGCRHSRPLRSVVWYSVDVVGPYTPSSGLAESCLPSHQEVLQPRQPVVRICDVDNQNKEGGHWVVVHDRVYDYGKFKSRGISGEDG